MKKIETENYKDDNNNYSNNNNVHCLLFNRFNSTVNKSQKS